MIFNDFRGPLGTKNGAKIAFKINVKADSGPGALQGSILAQFWDVWAQFVVFRVLF